MFWFMRSCNRLNPGSQSLLSSSSGTEESRRRTRTILVFVALALLLRVVLSPVCAAQLPRLNTPAVSTNTPAVPVVHPSLASASAAAAQDQSLVILIFRANWSGPCKDFQSQTLDSPEFHAQGGLLHLANLDVEADPKTARDFGIDELPGLVAMTGDGKLISRRSGFMRTAELMLWVREARELLAAGKWEGTAPIAALAAFTGRSGNLTSEDLTKLISMLADPDPAERTGALEAPGRPARKRHPLAPSSGD